MGCRICWWTTPAIVLSPRPSLRDWANAASRFGPVVPVAPARASVWQDPHFSANCSLPLTVSVPLSLSGQPPNASATTAPPVTTRPKPLLLIGRILTGDGDKRAAAYAASMRTPFLLVGAAWFAMMAGSNLATPLYAVYEREFGFSSAVLTVVFATYALVLAPSLLVFGQLSDRLGRRRVMAAGFLTATLGLVVFAVASALGWLFAARAIQGLAVGMISGAAAAALVELDPVPAEDRAALLASLAQAGGSASGPLVAGMLAEWAPARLVLPFALFAVLGVGATVVALAIPEPSERPGGARAGSPAPRALIVRPSVPPEIRVLFARVSVTGAAVWATAALFLSVVPPTPPTCSTPRTSRCSARSARRSSPRRARPRSRPAAGARTPACRPSGCVLLARGPARARARLPGPLARAPARRRPAHRRRPRHRVPRRAGPAQPGRAARPPRRGQRRLLHADLPRRRDDGDLHRPRDPRRPALDRGHVVRGVTGAIALATAAWHVKPKGARPL